MPDLKITYYQMKGLAEAPRLALTIGGIEFKDERLTLAEASDRMKEGGLPALPTLTVDGEVYTQSAAILRYCGQLTGLYPKDPEEAMLVDSIIDTMWDVVSILFSDYSEKARKDFVAETVPKFFGRVDKIFGQTDGPFLLGDDFNIADIRMYVVVDLLNNETGIVKHAPKNILKDYKNLQRCFHAIGELEKVKAWNAKPKLFETF